MTRGPIEGLQGGEDAEPRGVKAWNLYQQHADEMARADKAAEEAARAEEAAAHAAQGGAAPVEEPKGLAGAVGAAVGAAAAAIKQALTESPDDIRMDTFTAMQEEAFAHLEIPIVADNAAAAQRASDASDPGGKIVAKELHDARHFEGVEKDPDAARKPDATRPAPDRIAPSEKEPGREGREEGREQGRRDSRR